MARKHIHIPSGGRIDTSYLESIYEDFASSIKVVRFRLQD